MESDRLPDWVTAVVVALAIVLLIVLARGEPDRTPRGAAHPVAAQHLT